MEKLREFVSLWLPSQHFWTFKLQDSYYQNWTIPTLIDLSTFTTNEQIRFSPTRNSLTPKKFSSFFPVWPNHTTARVQGAAPIRQVYQCRTQFQSQGPCHIQSVQTEYVPLLWQCVDADAERCGVPRGARVCQSWQSENCGVRWEEWMTEAREHVVADGGWGGELLFFHVVVL